MLDKLFSHLTARRAERDQDAAGRYRELVAAIAAGDEPDVAKVEAVLRDAGRPPADLQADVALLQRRAAWRKTLDAEPALKDERGKLLQAKESAKAAFAATRAAHDGKIEDLNRQLARVEADLRDCDDARRQLGTTASAELLAAQRRLPTKHLYEKLQTAERELRAAEAVRAAWREDRAEWERAIAADPLVRLWAFAPQLRACGALPPLPPWDAHPPGFVRAALHVRARALAAGFNPGWLHLENLGLAHPVAYLLCLDDEPERRRDEPLRQVLADDPPARFVEFAERDERHKSEWWKTTGPEIQRHRRALQRGEPLTDVSPDLRSRLRVLGSLPPRHFRSERIPRCRN